MAYDDEFNEDDEFDSGAMKQVRDALKKANKKNEELQSQLDELLNKQRESTFADILKAKGVSPKAARFLKADGVDADEDAVNKWLADNADLFPVKSESKGDDKEPEGEKEEQQEAKPEPQQDPVFADALKAMQGVQDLEATAASTGDSVELDNVLHQIGQNDNHTVDDLTKLFAQLGAPGLRG